MKLAKIQLAKTSLALLATSVMAAASAMANDLPPVPQTIAQFYAKDYGVFKAEIQRRLNIVFSI
ncbi:hypothetical protein B0181_10245 [Moraxella caviae]|uniref:Uncharacterized protein n=1 Tax=Moraxella caviae TaxID=34060 RepID=A0A1S9ZVG4_9GAMM|nr:hypothetical protein [Moraxella caviae]OOR87474.1 hypothetical protein B0181_10245 [Moraxella caviae]STZ10625.1 Uncharacterised protein [Moraxella caviae]